MVKSWVGGVVETREIPGSSRRPALWGPRRRMHRKNPDLKPVCLQTEAPARDSDRTHAKTQLPQRLHAPSG